MRSDTGILKEKLKRWTLILGVFQVTVGCIIGLIPPTAVEWFRGDDYIRLPCQRAFA